MADDLYFTYKGNQHTGILENSNKTEGFKSYLKNNLQTHYTYNANGAMIRDEHKGISMQYKRYNGMPRRIDVDNDLAVGVIYYEYTHGGRKLSAQYSWNVPYSVNPVMGSIQPFATVQPKPTPYSNSKLIRYDENIVLHSDVVKTIFIENGYIEDGMYYFYLKDHLGNIRAVVDAQGNTVQVTDYYPFGMPTTASRNEGVQPYKYGGKEYDMMNGLEMYDFHARQYDPAISRFTSIDPMAEMYYSISPYAYCANNPLIY